VIAVASSDDSQQHSASGMVERAGLGSNGRIGYWYTNSRFARGASAADAHWRCLTVPRVWKQDGKGDPGAWGSGREGGGSGAGGLPAVEARRGAVSCVREIRLAYR